MKKVYEDKNLKTKSEYYRGLHIETHPNYFAKGFASHVFDESHGHKTLMAHVTGKTLNESHNKAKTWVNNYKHLPKKTERFLK